MPFSTCDFQENRCSGSHTWRGGGLSWFLSVRFTCIVLFGWTSVLVIYACAVGCLLVSLSRKWVQGSPHSFLT